MDSFNNTSFIKMKEFMDNLSIPCSSFHLKCNNPKLYHIDPYDDNLTEDEIDMIKEEILENIYYFFSEICKIKLTQHTLPILWGVCNCKSLAICAKDEDTDNDIIMFMSYYTAYNKVLNRLINLPDDDTVFTDLLAIHIISNNIMSELPPYLRFGSIKTYNAKRGIVIDSDCTPYDVTCNYYQQRVLFMSNSLSKGSLCNNSDYIGFNYYMIEENKIIDDKIVVF